MSLETQPSVIPNAESVAPKKTSTLAIVAFVFALIPVVGFVGFALGIVALVRLNEPKNGKKGKGWAIAAVALGALWFAFGILAAIAIPNFIKFQARSKQSEARVTLRSIQTSQRLFALEHGSFANTFAELGDFSDVFRYTYYMGEDKLLATKNPEERRPADVVTYVSKDGFRVVAVGNIDQDETLDVWVITEKGEVENVKNDVKE